MQTDATSATNDDPAARRSFVVQVAAIVTGAIVAIFPFAVGLGVILDPTRRRRAATGGDNGALASGPKFVRICPLDSLSPGGPPQAFPVILDVVDDAWTRTFNQKIGVIYLARSNAGGDKDITALNAKCPHLGCIVDFNREKGNFQCPCHESAFAENGDKLYGPSLRGMDHLATEVRTVGGQQEVYVAFEKFQPGIAERKPA
jgi:nitrite reductase/ring-hydroxylating ferredoxin subunit